MEKTRGIGGHRRPGPRRRGRAAVIATGLVAAVAVGSGTGAEASTPTITFSGLCALGVANILSPSPSSVSVGSGGSVKIVNNASALVLGDPTITVTSNGDSRKLKKGASTVFDYPENTSASTYTVSAKCAAVSVNVSARVTVAAKPVVATPVDPAPEPAPDPGGGSGGGSDPGSGGDSGTPAQPGTGSGPGTPTDTGSNPGQPGGAGGGTDAKPVPGATLPMGFAEPPVRIGAPGAGLPIPDVATGIPGAPGEASAPDVELFGTSAVQAAAQEDTRPVAAQSSDGHPSRRILLILVATVLLLGVGAAALRAVRGTRSVPVAARG